MEIFSTLKHVFLVLYSFCNKKGAELKNSEHFTACSALFVCLGAMLYMSSLLLRDHNASAPCSSSLPYKNGCSMISVTGTYTQRPVSKSQSRNECVLPVISMLFASAHLECAIKLACLRAQY